jgi:hypothetical protein
MRENKQHLVLFEGVTVAEFHVNGPGLITRGFGEHAAAMENIANVLSKNERLTLLRLLKKLGNTPRKPLDQRWSNRAAN